MNTVRIERIMLPPILPINCTIELDAPISRGSAEYCAERVVAAIVNPMPKPIGISPSTKPKTGNGPTNI